MKRILYISLLFILSNWVLSGCYKDEGNYTYHDINEVFIGEKGFVDTTYQVTAFVDTIRIEPELDFKLSENTNLVYEWKIISSGVGGNTEIDAGRERNLVYPVDLPAKDYGLYYKVTDTVNSVEYLRTTSIVVQSIQSAGWLLLGENDEGYVQMDMISIGIDTLILKNILNENGLPPLKKPTCLWVIDNYDKNMTHIGTEDGTYRIDRETFLGGEATHFKYSFYDPSVTDKFILQDAQQVRSYQRLMIVDGKAFHVGMLILGEFLGQPANHYKGDYNFFSIGDKIGVNQKNLEQSFVLYNNTDKRFVRIGGTGNGSTDGYCDSLVDTKNDAGVFAWKTGLDYVTTINSRYIDGYTYTVLKDPSSNKFYLYSYKIVRNMMGGASNIVKNRKYELNNCPDLENARFFGASGTRTYIIYATDSKLYAYDYQANKSKLIVDCGDKKITSLYYDLTLQTNGDFFYVATYDPALPASTGGTLTKYSVVNNPNEILIEAIPESTWTGLCKIKSIQYKRRYGF